MFKDVSGNGPVTRDNVFHKKVVRARKQINIMFIIVIKKCISKKSKRSYLGLNQPGLSVK